MPENKTLSGYNYNLNFGKFLGPFNFEVHQFVADEKFQQNDLGYFTNNNYFDNGFWMGYKWTKPKGFYNNLFFNANGNYSQRFKPRAFQYVSLNMNINGQLKNLWNVGINFNSRLQQQDFYEPRLQGKNFKTPAWYRGGFFVNTNRSKKYSASLQVNERISPKYNSASTEVSLSNNYRFNDKFSAGLSTYTEFGNKGVGFAYLTQNSNNSLAYVDSSVFGLRNRRTTENIFNVKYNFNIKMGLTFRARHYWSKVDYTRFFNLKEDGYLEDLLSTTRNPNINVNLFNVDLLYTWEFAQGSFINIAWKNAGEVFDQDTEAKYYNNFRHTLNNAEQNNFSVKVIYYLDYLSLKKRKAS